MSDARKPAIDPELLARAEQAVAALGDGFIAQLESDLARYRPLADDPAADGAADSLFAFAHDLRGQGGSFDYPLLSDIGTALCRYIEACDRRLTEDDAAALNAHFDAAAAIVANRQAGAGDAVAQAVVQGLDALVRKRRSGPC